ncbi:hypothetical protein [Nocardioides massiliensis]|uniref:Uncharacterized protein n=1 Tax=Nocardioides massiliensis TaxID=1325935 RepID=A0ABT9NJ38_9ACTN|nr:hypothetical protein [Nocardioides massiliensis]MDP9820422.1 hypothetical protein [Nocardioides massiliensis]
MSRATFLVQTKDARTPAARFTATDHVDLGEQIAVYLTRHRQLAPNVAFHAHIGSERGAIQQAGRVVTFAITQES